MNRLKNKLNMMMTTVSKNDKAEAFKKESGYYCDTGIVANSSAPQRIEIDFEYPNQDSIYGYIWGVSGNGTNLYSLQSFRSGDNYVFRIYSNETPYVTTEYIKPNTRYKIAVYQSSNRIILEINGNIIGSCAKGSCYQVPFYLGGVNKLSTAPSQFSVNELLIYSFRIFDNTGTTLLCDMQPKKVNGKTVLFDNITNQVVNWLHV